METVGEELLRDILVKLPTRDVARSCCVSRLWRIVVEDPSFRSLHGKAAHVVSGSGSGGAAQTLTITESRDDFKGLEMIVLSASPVKPLCRVTDLPRAYGPANACNGFILIATIIQDYPLYVCNPITSEKLKITPPPEIGHQYECSYAMGFSPSTCQYKLFRLSLWARPGTQDSHLDVYTLGAGRNGPGWRRSPYTLPRCAMYSTPPVLLDGSLYVVVNRRSDNINNGAPDTILAIDTASEMHCMYRLPAVDVAAEVHIFELGGHLCVAQLVPSRKLLCFWVMPSVRGPRLDNDMNSVRLLNWERRYTFKVNAGHIHDCHKPNGAWLDDVDGMLFYRLGDCLYKYDTTKKREKPERRRGRVSDFRDDWDQQIQLPAVSFESRDEDEDQEWNCYAGYRPSLVSPCLEFGSTSLPQHIDQHEQSNLDFQHAVRCKRSSKKRPSACPPHCTGDQHATKRIRKLRQ